VCCVCCSTWKEALQEASDIRKGDDPVPVEIAKLKGEDASLDWGSAAEGPEASSEAVPCHDTDWCVSNRLQDAPRWEQTRVRRRGVNALVLPARIKAGMWGVYITSDSAPQRRHLRAS